MSDTTYRIAESVVEDTLAFRSEVEKFLAGDISPVSFRAIRVPMGIYEQRENDTYMVRVRGAAGIFLPHQVRRVAEIAKEFGNGIVHMTTRQDLQIHRVMVQDTPTVLEKLLEVGLSSRGGGGNTVRNISACSLAGVCADEVFDVSPYALALTEYLIRERANFNLPRKFKAAFSGCSKDCSLASVADLGFFAKIKDGARGFSVFAAGGMGAHSALGVQVEEFIPAGAIFETAEAMKRLFDKEGDRTNRHKARLRYVMERLGAEEFTKLYRQELEQVRSEEKSFPEISINEMEPTVSSSEPYEEPEDAAYQLWKSSNVIPQKQQGFYAVRLSFPLGEVSASVLSEIAGLAETTGNGRIIANQDQELLIQWVPGSVLPGLYETLKAIDGRLTENRPVKAVACTGASTCKLGLGLSRALASAIEAELKDVERIDDTHIRISGCPNSCGQHPIAPLGLFGSARRVNGRLVPYYMVVAGGRTNEEGATLSESLGRVPARSVPALLHEFWTEAAKVQNDGETLDQLIERWGKDYLRALCDKYQHVPSYEEAPEFYRDWGSCQDFTLEGRGPGECGAGVMDVVSLDIDAARKAFEKGDLYDAVLSASRALLVTRGLEPKKDREVFAAFSEHLIATGWVHPNTQDLIDAALDFKLGDRETLNDLRDGICGLLGRVEQLYQSLDANLNFRIDPIAPKSSEPSTSNRFGADTACTEASKDASEDTLHELDLRGVACPMNFVRAKLQLEQLETGEVLEILLDDGEPVRNVPASFADQGEEVISVSSENSHFRVRVKKVSLS